MDLLAELRAAVTLRLAWLGVDLPPRTSARAACILLSRVLVRRLPATPRRVQLSTALLASPAYRANQSGIEVVAAEIRRGDELTHRMTTGVGVEPAGNDHLLNDWGMYHFHLGPRDQGPLKGGVRFARRTGPVLFAMFRNDAAYLVQVLDHAPAPWACRELLEIVHSEWRHLIAHAHLPGVVGLSQHPTEKEHIELRKAGIVTPLQLRDGSVYMVPGGGYSTSGLSERALDLADSWYSRTLEIQEWVTNNGRGTGRFELKIVGREVIAIESATRRLILLPDQQPLARQG